MLLLKCITLCLGTVHLLSRVTWSQRGGALTGLQPCAWTCLDMCPDMSGHSQNGVITEKNAKIFAPAKPCFNIHWVTLTVSGAK